MAEMVAASRVVVGGIDTPKDLHVAAVLDTAGAVLGTRAFSTPRAGSRALVRGMRSFGHVRRVGIEGTASYGAGVTRHVHAAGIEVLELDRPDRSDRRLRGKRDTLDAENAARAVLAGRRATAPTTKDGRVGAVRVLRLPRSTAVKSRRAALPRLRNHLVAAPEELREQVRKLTRMQLLRTCAAWRPAATGGRDPVVAPRIALRSRARRIPELDDELADLDGLIAPPVEEPAPALVRAPGIGVEIAGRLLVTAGDNPDRRRSEAAFAMRWGAAPLPASSGKTQRHRLNRGGDRDANSALHLAVMVRMRADDRTKAYVARRTADGLSKMEIIRCLKRSLAREAFALLRADQRPVLA